MIDTVEAITINFEEEGVLLVKEIDKEILSKKGAWVTVLFRYQDWQPKTEDYSSDKFSIRRYQKRNGEYKTQAKFAITSIDQARELLKALSAWIEQE